MNTMWFAESQNQAPLSGIRVVEFGAFITAPLTAQLLADLGAEVIKVEQPPRGDPFRNWDAHDYSPVFYAFNRSKQSLAIDLKTEEGQKIRARLVEAADVVVHNFRPAVAERLGIDYKSVKSLNPSVVYCGISGMGEEGPGRNRPSYDTVGQSLSGLLSLTTDPENPQIRGPALSDTLTGIYGALAVAAALRARETSGQGDRVDLNMVRATMSFLGEPYSYYFTTGVDPQGTSRPANSLAFVFKCSDGLALSIHLSSPDKFWHELLAVMDLGELADDTRFLTHRKRARHHSHLAEILTPLIGSRTRAQWMDILAETEIPHAPVYRPSEAASDPQIQALHPFREMDHPTAGPVRLVGAPFGFERASLREPTLPPEVGEHTRVILSELGFQVPEIDKLRARGVIQEYGRKHDNPKGGNPVL